MRRVVVTGMGVVSPLGVSLEDNFNGIISGKSAISRISSFDVSDYAAQVAGQVPWGQEEGQFNPDLWITPKEQRHLDMFVIYGIVAGLQALADAGYKAETEEEKNRSGVYVGTGIGGLQTIDATSQTINAGGPRRVSPFFIPDKNSGASGSLRCVVKRVLPGALLAVNRRSSSISILIPAGSPSITTPMASLCD